MRELSIAEFRQLTEGEKAKKYQDFFSPSAPFGAPPLVNEWGKGAHHVGGGALDAP